MVIMIDFDLINLINFQIYISLTVTLSCVIKLWQKSCYIARVLSQMTQEKTQFSSYITSLEGCMVLVIKNHINLAFIW